MKEGVGGKGWEEGGEDEKGGEGERGEDERLMLFLKK